MKRIFLAAFVIVCGAMAAQAQSAAVRRQILNRLIRIGEVSAEEVRQNGGIERVLNIRSVDLNRDGRPEYLVFCECSLGTTPFVFRKTARGVSELFVGVVRSTVTLSKGYTKGWRNLEFEEPYSPGYQEKPLRFDGKRYKY